MEHSYAAFRQGVKDDLRGSLSAWKLSEEDLEKFVAQEEGQIKGAYEDFLNPRPNDKREEGIRFKTGISTIAYCLQMCY